MNRILPILALLFAFGVFMLYIRPTYAGPIAQSKEKVASYDSALAAAARFEQKEAELTQAKAAIPADGLDRLNEFLPDGVNNVQLILDLDALAARSGVTLTDFDTKTNDSSSANTTSSASGTQETDNNGLALEQSSPVDSLDLTFKATGSYESFRTFMAGMETSLRPLDVINLNVAQSDTGVYSYDVTTRIYWLH